MPGALLMELVDPPKEGAEGGGTAMDLPGCCIQLILLQSNHSRFEERLTWIVRSAFSLENIKKNLAFDCWTVESLTIQVAEADLTISTWGSCFGCTGFGSLTFGCC